MESREPSDSACHLGPASSTCARWTCFGRTRTDWTGMELLVKIHVSSERRGPNANRLHEGNEKKRHTLLGGWQECRFEMSTPNQWEGVNMFRSGRSCLQRSRDKAGFFRGLACRSVLGVGVSSSIAWVFLTQKGGCNPANQMAPISVLESVTVLYE